LARGKQQLEAPGGQREGQEARVHRVTKRELVGKLWKERELVEVEGKVERWKEAAWAATLHWPRKTEAAEG